MRLLFWPGSVHIYTYIYMYTFHRYKILFKIFMQLAIYYICMPYALFEVMCEIALHICSIDVAFELTIDYGILRCTCTFATSLVIFEFRLITFGR